MCLILLFQSCFNISSQNFSFAKKLKLNLIMTTENVLGIVLIENGSVELPSQRYLTQEK